MSHPDKPSAPEVYYEAFGRFIQYYALAETQVHLLFWHISGLHLNAARSISSGMRLSDLMTITKSVIASRDLGEELASKVENAFTHLSEIGSLRDKLVHRGAEITENVIISSNAKTAATKENIEVMRLNIGDIRLSDVRLHGNSYAPDDDLRPGGGGTENRAWSAIASAAMAL